MSNRKFDMVTSEPISGVGIYRFTFDHDIVLIQKEPVIYRQDGVGFEFSTRQTGPREILIEVLYEINTLSSGWLTWTM